MNWIITVLTLLSSSLFLKKVQLASYCENIFVGFARWKNRRPNQIFCLYLQLDNSCWLFWDSGSDTHWSLLQHPS